MEYVNIITLQSDIFIKSTTKDKDIPYIIDDEGEWEFEVRSTEGENKRYTRLRSKDIENIRLPSCSMCEIDWATLVYHIFFNELKSAQKSNYELIGYERKDESWDIEICTISHGLKNLLGTVKLRNPLDENEDEYDPFQWAKLMKQFGDQKKAEADSLDLEVRKLRVENSKIVKDQQKFVQGMNKKQQHQLKVFTKVLNDQQAKYRKLVLEANITDPSDEVINLDYIKSVDQTIKLEETNLESKPGPKRIKKEKSGNTSVALNRHNIKKDLKEENVTEKNEPELQFEKVIHEPSAKLDFTREDNNEENFERENNEDSIKSSNEEEIEESTDNVTDKDEDYEVEQSTDDEYEKNSISEDREKKTYFTKEEQANDANIPFQIKTEKGTVKEIPIGESDTDEG
ncbi:hypothetical protein WICMUC_005603 [Wickerhamomyces mucosus]|uniref:Uncharacterized protein n=1 Tax=Wickerhamomyces mucosus TaxID=1378264 RepID=A0A9P8T5S0_9ASCO|nr:hypothetical protein WICMUC_005603 [Wickerhamomyces mucosus]